MLLALTVLWAAVSLLPSVLGHGPLPIGDEHVIKQRAKEIEHRAFHQRCPSAIAKRGLEDLHDFAHRDLTFGDYGDGSLQPRADGRAVLLAPEVTQGPYHVRDEILRQDITEGQPGIPLQLFIDFIDMATCKPVPNIYVDVWQANATGYYSGYTELDPYYGCFGFDPVTLAPPTTPPAVTFPPAPQGTGPAVAADPANATWADTPKTDDSNFLRGVWKTDALGRLTMKSILPGHYPCRAIHLHIKAITEGRLERNRTVAPIHTVHTGQIFLDEAFTQAFLQVEPYSSDKFPRINNTRDFWYRYATGGGYDADLGIAYLDRGDIKKGVVGKIAVGLNMSFVSYEVSDQFYQRPGK